MSTTKTAMSTSMHRPMRADARRNYELLLTTASAVFAEQGPDVCLDKIAHQAGVGVGTLYRHFPTRQTLLEAVYRSKIEELSIEAENLLSAPSAGEALAAWLRTVLIHNLTQRGLKEALMVVEGAEVISACKERLHAAGGALLARAQLEGDVRPDLTISDLLKLVHGIALVTEKAPAGSEQAQRLLEVMLGGLQQRQSTAN